MRTDRRIACAVALLLAALAIPARAADATEGEVRAMFESFVQVQNAHDPKALETLLADSPQFLWITRGTAIWGREAALQRFTKLYEGTWRLDPRSSTFPSSSPSARRANRPRRRASC